MRKALRIFAISAGIISVVSAVVLAVIYMEDILEFFKNFKGKFSNKLPEFAGKDEE